MRMQSRSPSKRIPAIAEPAVAEHTPGPNAFARFQAEAERVQEVQRMKTNAFYQLERSKPFERARSPKRVSFKTGTDSSPYNDQEAVKEEPDSIPMTTMTQFVEHGKDSMPVIERPRVALPPAQRRFDGTRPELLLLVPKSTDNEKPTKRAEIEAKNEKKLQRMMGQIANISDTPSADDPFVVSTTDLRPPSSEMSTGSRSPRKRFLGMSIPSFRSTPTQLKTGPTSPDEENIPAKAAQLLGPSRSMKSRSNLRTTKQERSETTQSLPHKFRDSRYTGSTVATPSTQGTVSTYGALQGGVRLESEPILKKDSLELKRSQSLRFYNDAAPPTPPAKNTPPTIKTVAPATLGENAAGSKLIHSRHRSEGSNAVVNEVPLDTPTLGISLAQGYQNLIHKVPSVYSMHGVVENTVDYLKDVRRPSTGPPENRGSDGQQRRPDDIFPGAYLPPTFYSPSVYSSPFRPSHNDNTNIYTLPTRHQHLFTHTVQPSGETIQLIFQGKANELTSEADPVTSSPEMKSSIIHAPDVGNSVPPALSKESFDTADMNVMHPPSSVRKVQTSAANGADEHAEDAAPLKDSDKYHPEGEDIPAPVAPSQYWNDSFVEHFAYPNLGSDSFIGHPSAIPSPLRPFHQLPPGTVPGHGPSGMILPDGSNMVTHFGVVNHHIDAVTQGILTTIESGRHASYTAMKEMHENTVKLLNEHANDIVRHVNQVEHNVGQLSSDAEITRAKLEGLFDVVQKELVGPFRTMLDRNEELLKEMKGLRQKMEDMQKKWEAAMAHSQRTSTPTSTDNIRVAPFPLPQSTVMQMKGGEDFRSYCSDFGRRVADANMSGSQHHPAFATRRPQPAQYMADPFGGDAYGTAYTGYTPATSAGHVQGEGQHHGHANGGHGHGNAQGSYY